eukprot:TRINITY_DN23546_c0_g1_i1.p1 TRINITY_DN23546_c0_g1~~TRINITY_DN23546_c0_g1_i1.p1  ORF type:complete len:145 (+),score=22.94 TRINITY_DN23546_c0_g1_i1:121-555(+)
MSFRYGKRAKKPDGWDLIEPTLTEIAEKMRDAELQPYKGKRKGETAWPILRLHHQRSRYIFDMYYQKKSISRELYDYCLEQKIVDAALIAKWKKIGYERLCCLQCIQTRDHNAKATCICRVPKRELTEEKALECVHCGCSGCAN